MNKQLTITCTFIFISLLLISCSSAPDTYIVEEIDGVKHIHNSAPLWGDEERFKLEYIQTFGGMEVQDEDYILSNPLYSTRDTNGNLYILDRGDFVIKKYDPRGKHLKSFGEKGQGPGEFDRLNSIDISSNNMLYVFQGTGRISIFDTVGVYHSEKRHQYLSGDQKLIGEANILANNYRLFSRVGEDLFLFGLKNASGTFFSKFGKPLMYENLDKTFAGNKAGFDLDKDDNIYVAYKTQNRIEKYDDSGRLIWISDRPLNYELEYKEVKQVRDIAGKKQEITFPSFSYTSLCEGVDLKGRFWVMTLIKPFIKGMRRSEFLEYEIFNSEGILLTKVPIPDHQFHVAQNYGDRIYFNDTAENAAVYEYKIIEP